MKTQKTTLIFTMIVSLTLLAACGDDGPTAPKEPTVLTNKIVFTKEVSHPENEANSYAYELHLMNPDGSGESTLKDSPSREEFFPDISPNGTKIVLMVTAPDPDDYHGDIAVVTSDGTGFHKLTNSGDDAHPTWSRDGSKIVFHSRRSGNEEIYIMNADGSGIQQITDNKAEDTQPEFSHDGLQIYFNSDRDGDFEIYSIKTDGTGLKKITDNFVKDIDPAPSPDGSRVAFTRDLTGVGNLFVLEANGQAKQLTFYSDGYARHPTWSPDGSRIAFEYGPRTFLDESKIYTISSNGGTPVALTKAVSSLHPSWSSVE